MTYGKTYLENMPDSEKKTSLLSQIDQFEKEVKTQKKKGRDVTVWDLHAQKELDLIGFQSNLLSLINESKSSKK